MVCLTETQQAIIVCLPFVIGMVLGAILTRIGT